jgi:hypothetical protein
MKKNAPKANFASVTELWAKARAGIPPPVETAAQPDWFILDGGSYTALEKKERRILAFSDRFSLSAWKLR